MSAELVTYALLSGAGPVTAIVGTRIYPVVLPVGVPTAAIVYAVISSPRIGAIDAYAPTHLTRSRVQVNVLSADHKVLRDLRNAVVAAMQFQRGLIAGITVHSVLFSNEGPDFFDQEQRIYMRPIDFLLSHEAT